MTYYPDIHTFWKETKKNKMLKLNLTLISKDNKPRGKKLNQAWSYGDEMQIWNCLLSLRRRNPGRSGKGGKCKSLLATRSDESTLLFRDMLNFAENLHFPSLSPWAPASILIPCAVKDPWWFYQSTIKIIVYVWAKLPGLCYGVKVPF